MRELCIVRKLYLVRVLSIVRKLYLVRELCIELIKTVYDETKHRQIYSNDRWLKIYNNLRYETLNLGVKAYVTSLSRNRVSKLDTWSCLEEALRFLNLREVDQKLNVLQEQFEAMRATPIGQKFYHSSF